MGFLLYQDDYHHPLRLWLDSQVQPETLKIYIKSISHPFTPGQNCYVNMSKNQMGRMSCRGIPSHYLVKAQRITNLLNYNCYITKKSVCITFTNPHVFTCPFNKDGQTRKKKSSVCFCVSIATGAQADSVPPLKLDDDGSSSSAS